MKETLKKDQQAAYDFFMNVDSEIHSKKIKGLTTPPTNIDLFELRLIAFCTLRSPNIRTSTSADVFEQIVPRENILNILDYFEKQGCLCVKICFGLDEHYYPQALVSGSFVVAEGSPRASQVDSYYTDKIPSGQSTAIYFLNFDQRIIPKLANDYIACYQEQAPLSDLHGYILDIATYRYFLTDEQWLGKAESVQLRFGMNNAGEPGDPGAVSGRAQIMSLQFAPANGASGKSFYFCLSSVRDDDENACPPRQPCSPPAPEP